MVVAAVLAGGSGTRMGTSAPKQYLLLANEPILVHSVRAFVLHEQIDKICVVVPEAYTEETENLLRTHFPNELIAVIAGGQNRSTSLLNAARHFAKQCPQDTVILTHDAVRPFITKRIIDENIAGARRYGAVGTVIPAVDTLLLSEDGHFIASVPPRSTAFHAQTPQTFDLHALTSLLEQADETQHERFTDGCSVFMQAAKPVFMVRGEPYNIKITYPDDLSRAEEILKNHFSR